MPEETCPGHPHKTCRLIGRKQSASDLQSRLKTRKLLGVGEVCGDHRTVYKSKISQLLGINESLYVEFPRGLLWWNTLNSLYFFGTGALCVLLPWLGALLDLGVSPSGGSDAVALSRAYGVLLFAFGVLFRSLLLHRETRNEVASLLLVVAFVYAAQIAVQLLSPEFSRLTVLIRLFGLSGNLIYHSVLDPQGGILRQFARYIEDLPSLSLHTEPLLERSNSDKDK